MNNNMKRKFLSVLMAGCAAAVQAAPTLPQVVSGQVTFGQIGNVFTITNTPNAIINWQSFSINPGEVTRFVQQSADSAVLNRITGQHPSQILGALQSNGHVFLINPNGILFGRDSRIDVNGLTASTLGLSDAGFLAGRRNFSAGTVSGNIANDGSIATPDGGKVFLIAAAVENTGIITAPNGEVVLAAGRSVQLADSANPDLRVIVSAPAGAAVNVGQLLAPGGRVAIYGALVRRRAINASVAERDTDGIVVLRGAYNAPGAKSQEGAEPAGAPAPLASYAGVIRAAMSGKGRKGGSDEDSDDEDDGDEDEPAQPVTPPLPPVKLPAPPVSVPTPPVGVPPVVTPAPPVEVPPVVTPAPPVEVPPVVTPAPPVEVPPVVTPAPPVEVPPLAIPAPPVAVPPVVAPAPPVQVPPVVTPAPAVELPPVVVAPVAPPLVTPPVAALPVVTPPPAEPAPPVVVAPPVLAPPSPALTFDQCIASPATPGCASLLPGLGACTASPSTPGCALVLPTLAQCAVSPGLQGCSAVVPAPDACTVNPALPACAVVSQAPASKPGASPLATALQHQAGVNDRSDATQTTPAEAEPAKKDDPIIVADAALSSGAKDESPRKTKTYCN